MVNTATATQATKQFCMELRLDNGVFVSVWKDGREHKMCLSNFPSTAQLDTPAPGGVTYGELPTWECWLSATDEDLERLTELAARTLSL